MRRVPWFVLFMWGVMPALRACGELPQGSGTPRERYEALAAEQQRAVRDFFEAYKNVKGQEEQRRFFDRQFPRPEKYIPRFREIAESDPHDPAAVDALTWIVMNGGCDPAVYRAVERLAAKHGDSRKLGEISPRLIPNLIFSASPAAEGLFRAIIAKNPDRLAQGRACLALANYLKRESDLVRAMKGDTPQARQLVSFYQMNGLDASSLNALRSQDADELLKRSEAMRARTAQDYADIGDILGAEDPSAVDRLWENPKLSYGQPAPEISGTDLDGKPLRLSDYKGKVVVLLFWGDWSRPSRAMYAPTRSLVQKMERRPFVLLGVSGDKDREGLKRRIAEEKINWRSWWDGGDTHGPIAAEFRVEGWPAVYILDHHGVIRYKRIGLPDDEVSKFTRFIDELVGVASKEAASSPSNSR